MAQYISKDALVAEIEKMVSNGKAKCQLSIEINDHESYVAWSEHIATCGKILSFLNTLEVTEVDFHKELLSFYRHTNDSGSEIALAKHFFELGLKAEQKGE